MKKSNKGNNKGLLQINAHEIPLTLEDGVYRVRLTFWDNRRRIKNGWLEVKTDQYGSVYADPEKKFFFHTYRGLYEIRPHVDRGIKMATNKDGRCLLWPNVWQIWK